jgi:hypothetical protein
MRPRTEGGLWEEDSWIGGGVGGKGGIKGRSVGAAAAAAAAAARRKTMPGRICRATVIHPYFIFCTEIRPSKSLRVQMHTPLKSTSLLRAPALRECSVSVGHMGRRHALKPSRAKSNECRRGRMLGEFCTLFRLRRFISGFYAANWISQSESRRGVGVTRPCCSRRRRWPCCQATVLFSSCE